MVALARSSENAEFPPDLFERCDGPVQVFFLVRGQNCGGNGAYDTDQLGQVGLRDAEIAASGKDCP